MASFWIWHFDRLPRYNSSSLPDINRFRVFIYKTRWLFIGVLLLKIQELSWLSSAEINPSRSIGFRVLYPSYPSCFKLVN